MEATRSSSKTSSSEEIEAAATSAASTSAFPAAVEAAATGEVNRAQAFVVLEDWGDRERSAEEIAGVDPRQGSGAAGRARERRDARPRSTGAAADPMQGGARRAGLRDSSSQWSDKIMALAQRRTRASSTSIRTTRSASRRSGCPSTATRAAELGVSLETVGRTLETHAGLAHRHDFHQERARVLRDPAGAQRGSRRPDGSREPVRALRSRQRADSAGERREARGARDVLAAQPLRPAARHHRHAQASRPDYSMGEAVEFFRKRRRNGAAADARSCLSTARRANT